MGKDRLRQVADQIREKEETGRSLRLASLRQQRMLPDEPDIEGFEFAVDYRPAAGVSGDFYDFIPVGDGKWGIVVGDVSGHGVEAGIIMGMAKQTVSIYGKQMERPVDVLSATNAELYRSLDGKTFVSMSYAVLDVESLTLRFVRCGQCRPLRLNPRWKIPAPQVVESKGLALGVDSGRRFARLVEEIDLRLEPGDVFFQYTDGLVEATNKEREQFGEERLMDVLQRYSRTSAHELVEIVYESMNDFTRAREQEDDITMVSLKVRDPQVLTRTARFDIGQVGVAAEKRGLAPPAGFEPPAPRITGPLAGMPPPGPRAHAPPTSPLPPAPTPEAPPAESPAKPPIVGPPPEPPPSATKAKVSVADILAKVPSPKRPAPRGGDNAVDPTAPRGGDNAVDPTAPRGGDNAVDPPAGPKPLRRGEGPTGEPEQKSERPASDLEREGRESKKKPDDPDDPDADDEKPRRLKLPPLPDFMD